MKKRSLKSLRLKKSKVSNLTSKKELLVQGGSGLCQFTPDIVKTALTIVLNCNSKDCSFDAPCNPNSDAAGGASCDCPGFN